MYRKADLSIQTYYRWRSKYGALTPSEMTRLKQIKEENVRLKRLVTNLSLNKEMLQTSSKMAAGHCAAICARNLNWFDFWLEGVEDSDPAKREQYGQRQKLRDQKEAPSE